MSDYKPTPAQAEAMYTRDRALLVSAGAGSGKTQVLIERVLHLVTDGEPPVDLDRFLIITFTRAAAAELRGRIQQELSKRLAKEPENTRLRRQSALCQRAHIGTIHSFCSELLRENCQAAGLSPDFKILDEERSENMRAAALDRVLEKRYAALDGDPGFRLLADTAGAGRDDRALAELVLRLHARMQCHERPERWAQEQIDLLSAPVSDAGETPWGRTLLNWAKELCDYWSAEMDALVAEMAREERILASYGEAFTELGAILRDLSRRLSAGWEKTLEVLPTLKAPALKALRNSPDPELSERLKERRKDCLKALDKIQKQLYAPSDELLADLRETAPAMEALLRLTLDFDREYARDKRARSLVDYADLEHMAARLLIGDDGGQTPLARQLSERFAAVMVDEYQDVSRVQDAGDVKQSIYRFRLADPEIFNEKAAAWRNVPETAKCIALRENFRSRREILDAVNTVFSLCMSRSLGDVDYDADAALVFGADSYKGEVPKPELLLLELPPADEEESPDRVAAEAAFAARRIRELVESGASVTTPEGVRPMEYGDVAILLRSPNTVGGVYRRALLAEGIPVGKAQGSGFFSSLEITVVLSMLAVMDNPHKDIPLIAVLRSPAFGFTPDDLAAVRAADAKADFYGALEKAAERNERCRAFLETLSALRGEAADLSAAETVWLVLEKLDLLALCSAMEDGSRRRENLLALVELSEGFEATGYRGLHRFVLWLQALAARGQEPSPGASLRSAVQILSIHKSKGLEYPVVFLCDSARRFNAQDRQETVLVHPVLGLGPRVVDLEKGLRYPSLARLAIARRSEREDLSEELRLLYVAMTRARERLIITAAYKDPEKEIAKARRTSTPPFAPEMLAGASCMAEWLIRAALADGGEHLELRVCPDEAGETREAQTRERPPASPEDLRELRRRLAFRYEHAAAVELPSKLTATELKGREEGDGDAELLVKPTAFGFRMPELGQGERPLTAAERGVATHLLLQYMDFEKGRSRAGIKAEIERLRDAQFLSPREAEAVNVSAVERLFASALGARMLAAREPLREFRFSLLLDAGALYPGAGGEQLLLQGVVDCCLEEDGGLVIIDYKTDRVRTEEEIAARAALYRGQLRAYAEALRRILNKPVRECLLYFLTPGKTVRVELD